MLSYRNRSFLNVAIMALGSYWIYQNPAQWSGYFALFYGATVVLYTQVKMRSVQKTDNQDNW